MSLSTLAMPCIAYPTNPSLPPEVSALQARLAAKTKEPQGAMATELMQNAASELLDTLFTELFNALVAANENEHSYRSGRAMVREINEKLTHYLGWASSFFSNDRIRPAVEHYAGMMHELSTADGAQPFIAFTCPPALAARVEALLPDLQAAQASSPHKAIEVLIEVIDVAMKELLITPKKLMKFNFVVDKTLGGVISLMQTAAYRSLRKIADHLPAEHQPILAAHMQRLVRTQAMASAA